MVLPGLSPARELTEEKSGARERPNWSLRLMRRLLFLPICMVDLAV